MVHALVAVFCLLLLGAFTLTLCRLHGRRELLYLMPAIGLTGCLVALETLLLAFPSLMHSFMGTLLLNQVLLCPAWLLFSLSFGRPASWAAFSKMDKLLLAFSLLPLFFVLFLPTTAFYYQTDFKFEPILFLEQESFYFYLFLVLINLISIGNLESTLRNSKHLELWRIKLALLGATIIIASLILFYSQGLLYKAINMNMLPLRNSGICAGLLLLLYAEWRRKSGDVIISKKIAFRSLVVVLASIYLLGLGLAREGTRLFGDDFIHMLSLFLAGLAVLAGLLLLLSHSVRRKVSIWVQRHLYDEKYDYRGQWLQFSERLSLATDYPSFVHAMLVVFCETFGRSGAFYLPIDNDSPSGLGQGFYYEVNENIARSIPPDSCSPLLYLPPTPIRLEDTESGALADELTRLLGRMRISIVLPIRAADEPEGVLFLGRPIDGKERYDVEDYELMEAMGRQAGLCVKSFRLSNELATSREMEAIGRLGTFVMHDLKNQVYALSLLTNNAHRYITEPNFQRDMLETLGNTVANMKILITQLTHLPTSGNMRFERTDLYNLAVKATSQVPGANVSILGKHLYVTVDSEQMSKVFTNLCLNAVEAGGNKPIQIEIDEKDVPLFRIHDNAGGIDEEVVRHGLFKPFNTTKQRGMGIGLYHTRKIVEGHDAKISVDNRPGIGCTFTVRFEGERELSRQHQGRFQRGS